MNKITIAVIVLCIAAIAAGLVAWSVTRKSPARGCIAPISENVTGSLYSTMSRRPGCGRKFISGT